ncbi:16S rRNA (guanine(527)-N(7))-methyltransferase RsmG [Limimaricola variabilis]|uniref:16S rRNA (guanine(527)-N(7))-methyltransferase RsmG n=1 Tax=Limimaricola variabilis TaxID=1492771 RepID=UPI002AC93BA1|nr:16S rRNA (guanine(527)-N(7))-methyltransferase RsmG [Limimaricola variabilis]WPY93694.1 16S rRNA (guanine(527)-N(7))-methyltransferase RsmG [Limimaricola variabilis]
MSTAEWVVDGTHVSRETADRLRTYCELIRKWSPKINLVSRRDLDELETRHIADSLQLSVFLDPAIETWADLGSGGGFPGIVLAICGLEKSPATRFHLVESDARKAAFLRTAIRELKLNAQVHDQRIENTPPLKAERVSARALASLDNLLDLSSRHLTAGGLCVFPKGQSHAEEIETACKRWNFDVETHSSATDPNARILVVSNLSHV